MKTLALIPARGGSKGIPKKNINLFFGKPLIAWTIEAALKCPQIDRVVVSTDSLEIAEIAAQYGAEVPFIRPPYLSTDEASTIDVVMHAFESTEKFDSIVLLQPTSPLRTHEDIGHCLEYAISLQASSVVAVCEAAINPNLLYSISVQNTLMPFIENQISNRRQDYPTYYQINGSIYYARMDWLLRQRKFIGIGSYAFVMPPERSIDIDTPYDWRLAEFLKGNNL